MPHALIVAHGQPSDPVPAETSLAAFAADVDRLCNQVTVRSATLAAPGILEERLADLPDTAVIYPLFMAKGWFVTSALPKRLGERQLRILDPLGVDPELPAMAADALQNALSSNHWSADSVDLVLAAHGSGRSRNPSAVAKNFAAELARQVEFRSVRLGFVEEAPSIAEAAEGLTDQALCLPFFACTGGHVLEDVPEALNAADFKGLVLPVIGELPEVKRHIAATLTKFFKGN